MRAGRRHARAGALRLLLCVVAAGYVGGARAAEQAALDSGFVTSQADGQWLASRMIGTTVVGPGGETVGDVSDVVIGQDGRAVALVIGVGGFLGIGEKTVAVPLDRVEMTALLAGSAAREGAPRAPDKVILHATRDALQAAPAFRAVSRPLPTLPRLSPDARHH